MFDIQYLIWVVPGVIGLKFYNRLLSRKLPQAEGWAYLFSVVGFAVPYHFINILLSSYGLVSVAQEIVNPLIVLFVSTLLALVFAYLAAKLKNKYDPAVLDPLQNCCYLWAKKLILLTLKNDEVHLAVLIDYTKDIRFESTIGIVPIYSGYLDSRKKIHWTVEHPAKADLDLKTAGKTSPGTVIAQSEIATISLWDHTSDFPDTIEDANDKK